MVDKKDTPDNVILFPKIPRKRPNQKAAELDACLLYTSPSPRDAHESRMPSSA